MLEVAHDPSDRLGLEYLGLYGDFTITTELDEETGEVKTVYLDFDHRASDTFINFRGSSIGQVTTMAINWVHEWQDERESERAIAELNRQLELEALVERLDSELGEHETARLADLDHENSLDVAWETGYKAGYADAKEHYPDFTTMLPSFHTGTPLVSAAAASAYEDDRLTRRASCDACS